MDRRVLYIALMMAACNGVTETGPAGMVGRLIDADGEPIRNVWMESEEQRRRTTISGDFAVQWKAPATFVHFEHGGLRYKRVWMPKKDRGKIDLRLPPSEETVVSCRPSRNCTAELVWEFPDGLRGVATIDCAPKAPQVRLSSAPVDVPLLTCRDARGVVDVRMRRGQGSLRIESPDPAIKAAIKGGENCEVRVLHGKSYADGRLEITRPTWAWAVCEGRNGQPVPVAPGDRKVALIPPSGGVDLPAAGRDSLFVLRLRPDGSAEWQMHVRAHEDVFKLPELQRGEYRSVLGDLVLLGRMNPPDPEIPGTMVFHQVGDGYLGALRLEEDTPEGTLQVDGL